MHTQLPHCLSCMPEDFAPERLKPYGVSGLGAFDPKPIMTAMAVIGALVIGGIVLTVAATRKK
jgi:hypothetical protein